MSFISLLYVSEFECWRTIGRILQASLRAPYFFTEEKIMKMDYGLYKYLIIKAQKIYNYRMKPLTDEQFLKRKEELKRQYEEAERNYRKTSDKQYKVLMKKIKRRHYFIVSKSEYEECLKVIEEYKANFCEPKYKAVWEYIDDICRCERYT